MTTDTTAAPSQAPNSSLRMRALSAAILAPLVLGIIYMGGLPFTLMMAAAAMIGAYEWARMLLSEQENRPRFVRSLLALTAGISVALSALFSNPIPVLAFLMLGFAAVLIFNLMRKGPSLFTSMIGVVYIACSCAIMVWVRAGDALPGFYNLLVLLLIVWGSDIGAYFTGRTFGGPKLAPVISPKKTWSGFFGSSVAAGLVAAFMAQPWVYTAFETTTIGNTGPVGYFIMGFILAMFGQMGDLSISIYKRRYRFKDTGKLIPGHGGILDRIDALLLVAIVYGCIVCLFSGLN